MHTDAGHGPRFRSEVGTWYMIEALEGVIVGNQVPRFWFAHDLHDPVRSGCRQTGLAHGSFQDSHDSLDSVVLVPKPCDILENFFNLACGSRHL